MVDNVTGTLTVSMLMTYWHPRPHLSASLLQVVHAPADWLQVLYAASPYSTH